MPLRLYEHFSFKTAQQMSNLRGHILSHGDPVLRIPILDFTDELEPKQLLRGHVGHPRI